MGDIRPAGLHTRRTALMMATAAIPLWPQSKTGAQKMAHPVVHFEIGCRDVAKTGKFFSDLFGWNIGPGPAPAIGTGGESDISGHITALGHEPQHYTIFYVEVDDVQAALDKAASLGGKMLVPPIKIPTGTFAWFADPEGNTIGLLKRS